MYDRVKLEIPRMRDTPDLENYISVKGYNLGEMGELLPCGTFEGVGVSVYMGCIKIEGSLARLLYPNNIYPLDRHSTKDAMEKLSDGLHIDVTGAKVKSLEFGTCFTMNRKPIEYYSFLGEMPRMNRQMIDGSLYYKLKGKDHRKEFVFYDKIAEAKDKHMQIPKGVEDVNLLKYEMRFKCRLSQQLKIAEIKASTLYNYDFYRMLVERYVNSYFKIKKINRLRSNAMDSIKTPTDALNIFVAQLIAQSNPDINGFIEALKRANVFDDRKNYSRVKKKIDEVMSKGGATVPDELIKELDDEIKALGKNY